MFIFGHTGITLGVAVLINEAFTKSRVLPVSNELEGQLHHSHALSAPQNGYSGRVMSWFSSLATRIDIRLLLIGSILPDIIDKPIGRIFFGDIYSNGRIFCHTLLFLIVLFLLGLYLYLNYKKTWFLTLSFGTFIHLILDQMWLYSQTLLWPIFGLSFDKSAFINLGEYFKDMFYKLLTHPAFIIPELVGAAVIAWLVWLLIRRRMIRAFIRNGQV